jgi:hypothetical protein
MQSSLGGHAKREGREKYRIGSFRFGRRQIQLGSVIVDIENEKPEIAMP